VSSIRSSDVNIKSSADFIQSNSDVAAKSTASSYVESSTNAISSTTVGRGESIKKITHHCSVCNEKFEDMTKLQCHMKTSHKQGKRLKTPTKIYGCVSCREVFERKCDLNHHNSKFHDNNSYGCVICKAIFPSVEKLYKHGQEKHQADYLVYNLSLS